MQARIAFFQNQGSQPQPTIPGRAVNHPALRPVVPPAYVDTGPRSPPAELQSGIKPHIVVPKPGGAGAVAGWGSKPKLAPLNAPHAPAPRPEGEDHIERSQLPSISNSPDADSAPRSSFRDKVAMLGAVKGGGMAQYDYRTKAGMRPMEPEPTPLEPISVPEARSPLPTLVRPTRNVRKPSILDS
jgi:hypothetical protein